MERPEELEQIHSRHVIGYVYYPQTSKWNDFGFQPSFAVSFVNVFLICEKSTTHIFSNLTIWNINKQSMVYCCWCCCCACIYQGSCVFPHYAVWCTHFAYDVHTHNTHIWATNHECIGILNSTSRLTSCHGSWITSKCVEWKWTWFAKYLAHASHTRNWNLIWNIFD